MRLWEYPWVIVNIDCKLCPRRGRYRLARLAARCGPEVELERVLEVVAVDCQWMRPGDRPRKYGAKCGIRFTDLDGRTPRPPDLPPSLIRLRIVAGGRVDDKEAG